MTRRRTRRNGLLFGTGKRGAEQARNRRQGRRLRFESLEDRRLLAAFEVTSLRDAGAGTLRQAILDAESSPGADTITFASSLTAADDATINLTSCATDVATGGYGPAAFLVTSEIIITGPTGDNGITVARAATASNFRLFLVRETGNLTLENLTLADGYASGGDGGTSLASGGGGGAGMGGAIYNLGDLTLTRATLTGNTAQGGAGANDEGSAWAGGGGGGMGGDGQGGSQGGDGGGVNGGESGTDAHFDGYDGGIGGGGGGAYRLGGDGGDGGDGGWGGGGGGGSYDNTSGGTGGFGGGGGGYQTDAGSSTGGFGGGAGSARVGGGGAGMGGAVFNHGGNVVVTNSTLSDNTAQGGAGGASSYTAEAGAGLGGALFNYNGTVYVTNATFAENRILGDGDNSSGGSIYNLGDGTEATLTVDNTIAAYTYFFSGANEVVGHTINSGTNTTSGVGNLFTSHSGFDGTVVTTENPELGTLADNGGPTATHAMAGSSPARDAGDAAAASGLTTDQRGSVRVVFDVVDIGAYEAKPTTEITRVDNVLIITDTDRGDTDDSLTISLDTTTEPDVFVINDPSHVLGTSMAGASGHGTNTLRIPITDITLIRIDGHAGDDTLTLDFSGGNPIPSGGLTFHGGEQASGDSLHLINVPGTFTTHTYHYTSANDGSIVLNDGSADSTIVYTGLEPIRNDGDATAIIFNLPNANNRDVVLSDAGTSVDGDMLISGSTIENATFSVSSATSITINGNAMTDNIQVAGFDDAFTGADVLNLNGHAGADVFDINVAVPAGAFAGGAGWDELDISGVADSATVSNLDGNGADGSIGGGELFTDIETLTGNGNTLTGDDVTSLWNLDAHPTYEVYGNALNFIGFTTLLGGSEDDEFNFTADGATFAGTIDGRGGTNTLDYSGYGSGNPVTVDLTTGTATNVNGGGAGGISNIHNVTGGAGDDRLTGDGHNNALSGGNGDDSLTDGGGDDTLSGGGGDDTFVMTPGSADVINDSGGDDTADFSGSSAGIAIDMDLRTVQTVNGTNTVQLIRTIENFVGSAWDDTVSVNAVAGVPRDMQGGAGTGDALSVDAGAATFTDDGSSISFSGGLGTISYSGWESLSVTGGAVVVNGDSSDNSLVVTMTGADRGSYRLDGGPAVSFSGLTVFTFNAGDGADRLEIIYTGLSAFVLPFDYNGEGGTGDELTITGGTFETILHEFTGADSGRIDLDNDGDVEIDYSGLSPVLTNVGSVSKMIFELPAGGADAVLEDDDAYENAAHTSQLRSPSSHFERTSFTNPSASLTIRGGSGADGIGIAGLDTAFDADLTIHGGTDDTVTFHTNDTDIDSGDLEITAGSVLFNDGGFATTGNATVDATNGSVDSNGANTTDLAAATAVLTGTTGVGASNSLQTAIANLAAVGGTGGVAVDNQGSLEIGKVPGSAVVGVSATNASINITTDDGTITVSETIDSNGGAIGLDAGTDGDTTSDVEVNVGILSGGGAVRVYADEDVTLSASGFIDAESGNTASIYLEADEDDDSLGYDGAVTMADGSYIDAWDGNIAIFAYEDITISLLRSSADVVVDSDGGAILDADGGTGVDVNRGGTVVFASDQGVGSGADPLETEVGNLEAEASNGGPIHVDNTGALTIGGIGHLSTLDSGGGDIDISATGNITIGQTVDADTGDVLLTSSGGAIVDNNATGEDVVGENLELVASTGIGDAAPLEINAANLAATTVSGDIDLQDTADGLVITDLNVDGAGADTQGVTITGGAGEHDIVVWTSSPLTVNSPVTNNTGGNIVLAAEGATTTDDLTLYADVTVTGGDHDADLDGNIYLFAGDTISLASATVDVTTDAFGGLWVGAGYQYHGGLGAVAPDGTATGDVTMTSGSTIQSQDGRIIVGAPGNVALSILNANSDDDSDVGQVMVVADLMFPAADGIGAITDNLAGEAANVTGGEAMLAAATGIGSTDDIETDVTTLAAENGGTTGDIQIYQVAPGATLNGIQVNQLSQSNAGGSGDILLTTEDGDIEIVSGESGVAIAGSGAVTLDANADTPADEATSARGSIQIDAVVTTAGGDLRLDADHDVTGDANGDISSGGAGNVFITADVNRSGLGGNDDGTIQFDGDIHAGTGDVNFRLADCDGYVGATAGGADGIVTAANIILGVDSPATTGVLRLQAGTDEANNNTNTFSGTTTVVQGTLIVNGVLTDTAAGGGVVVQDGGVLGGNGNGLTTGAIKGDISVQAGGILDPGDYDNCTPAAGRLTVNGDVWMDASSTFRLQLNGWTPGAGYDQLVLSGEINIGGAPLGNPAGAWLDVSAGYSMPAAVEHTVIVYSHSQDDLIDQRFRDWNTLAGETLEEGDFFTTGGANQHLMNISYRTKTESNDVTLTHPGRYDFNHGSPAVNQTNFESVLPTLIYDGSTARVGWSGDLPSSSMSGATENRPFDAGLYENAIRDLHAIGAGRTASFVVDVAMVPESGSQDFQITIMSGDFYQPHDSSTFSVYDIYATGGEAWRGTLTASTGSGQFETLVFENIPVTEAGDTGLGRLRIDMEYTGGLSGWHAVINSLDIRPVDNVEELVLSRLDGVPVGNPQHADGFTVDSYEGTGAPPYSLITIAATNGVLTSTDDDEFLEGVLGINAYNDPLRLDSRFLTDVQVTSDASGSFSFNLQRPLAAGDVFIESFESSGLSIGSITQNYSLTADANGGNTRRFDFDGTPTVTTTVGGDWISVMPNDLWDANKGYGWTVAGLNADYQYGAADSDLLDDFHFGSAGTFRIAADPGVAYNLRIYMSDALHGHDDILVTFGSVTASSTEEPGYPVADMTPPFYPEGAEGSSLARNLKGTRISAVTNDDDGYIDIIFDGTAGWDPNFVVNGIDISTGDLPNAAALRAAVGSGAQRQGGLLGADALQPILDEARSQWMAFGLTSDQAEVFQYLDVRVADLSGTTLAIADVEGGHTILIDADAAGWGWFIDATPWEDSEYTSDDEPPAGMDLLTVVLHELGHMLGLEDVSAEDHPDAVMALSVMPGQTRRLTDGPLLASQNAENPLDIDANGAVTPLDVLRLINHINAHGTSLWNPRMGGSPVFADVTADGVASAADALRLINYLNAEQYAQITGGISVAEAEAADFPVGCPVNQPATPRDELADVQVDRSPVVCIAELDAAIVELTDGNPELDGFESILDEIVADVPLSL